MIIPYTELPPDTLQNLLEYYVLREGTDYGDQEVSLKQKVEQVRSQLQSGDILIVYSELHQTVNLITKQQFAAQEG